MLVQSRKEANSPSQDLPSRQQKQRIPTTVLLVQSKNTHDFYLWGEKRVRRASSEVRPQASAQKNHD